jgi:subtilase family serine protease
MGLLEINSGLAAGENLDTTKTFTIPASLSQTEYYLGFRIDSENSVTESDEDNNIVASLSTINISESSSVIPDLVANSVNVPSRGHFGDSISLDVDIENAGEASSDPFSIEVIIISDDDYKLPIDTVYVENSIGSGESFLSEITVNIPWYFDEGNYFIEIFVDSNDSILELNENNNRAESSNRISISVPSEGGPDLVANSVSGPANAKAEESIDLQIDLSNDGSANTGAFNVRVYLSTNTTITTSDTEMGLLEINSGLAAGENLDTTKTFTIPASISLSNYYFGIRVDSDNSVPESDEDNNRVTSLNTINVSKSSSGIPDLVANSINTSEEVSLNDSLGIDIEILNEGEGTVDNFDIKIYLSTNTTITSSDELVGEYNISEPISSGSGKTISKKVLITLIDIGDYYVGVVIDPDDDIKEEDENNNSTASDQITVSEEKYIDLVAVGLQTLGDGSFSYQLKASNIGNIDASGNFEIGVFLSKDEEADEKDIPITIHKGNYTIEAEGELEFTLEATEDTTDIDPGEYYMWFAINLEGSEEENIEDNIFINIENTIIVTEIVSNEGSNLMPKEFNLSQNYPNPFNPTTQIQYQLPKASAVSFGVYDMTGREVFSFRNQQKSAGSHTISFDASSLSSGIYIYQIKAGDFIQTKKMTLIK